MPTISHPFDCGILPHSLSTAFQLASDYPLLEKSCLACPAYIIFVFLLSSLEHTGVTTIERGAVISTGLAGAHWAGSSAAVPDRLTDYTCFHSSTMHFRLGGQQSISPTHWHCCVKQSSCPYVHMHHFVLASSKVLLPKPHTTDSRGKYFVGIRYELTFKIHLDIRKWLS